MSAILSTIKQLVISVVALGIVLLLATAVTAWTGPTSSAPDGNISAPINASVNAQIKAGSLQVANTNPATNNLVVGSGATSVLIQNGGVAANQFCLGTNCITSWSSLGGNSCHWVNVGAMHSNQNGWGAGYCPAGEYVAGLNWYKQPIDLDDEAIQLYCCQQ